MTPIEITDLLDALQVKDEKTGAIAICFSLAFTLYFRDGHLSEIRNKVAECLDHYLDICAPEIRWARLPHGRGFSAVNSRDEINIRSTISKADDDFFWEFTLHGGTHRLTASPFFFGVMAPPANRRSLSYIKASLPLDKYLIHPDKFSSLMIDFCKRLQPMSGYGGISLQEAPNDDIRDRHEPEVRIIATRFPGVDIDYPFYHVNYLNSGIKGVNWLTVLGSVWVDKIGGLGILKQQLGSEFSIHEYPGGVIIQSGGQPQLGDREQGIPVPLYARLSAILKPIRIAHHRPFHFSGLGKMDKGASEQWLARFD